MAIAVNDQHATKKELGSDDRRHDGSVKEHNSSHRLEARTEGVAKTGRRSWSQRDTSPDLPSHWEKGGDDGWPLRSRETVQTIHGNWIDENNLCGNVPNDGHSLAKAIATTEQITGIDVTNANLNKGYRVRDDMSQATVHISDGSSRKLTRTQKKRRKRRSAVEQEHETRRRNFLPLKHQSNTRDVASSNA